MPATAMYDVYIVRRTQIYLEEDQARALSDRASAAGRTKSELIRDALDAYLAPSDGMATDLTRFRAAVAAAAGIAPYLDAGRDYVAALRTADRERERELTERRRAL